MTACCDDCDSSESSLLSSLLSAQWSQCSLGPSEVFRETAFLRILISQLSDVMRSDDVGAPEVGHRMVNERTQLLTI